MLRMPHTSLHHDPVKGQDLYTKAITSPDSPITALDVSQAIVQGIGHGLCPFHL
jgi:hypothetical protein